MIAQSAIQADIYIGLPHFVGDYTGKPRLGKQMSLTRRFLPCARGIMFAKATSRAQTAVRRFVRLRAENVLQMNA